MITISITEEAESISDMVIVLQEIARLLEQGNTSGFYPTFRIEGEEETETDE